MGGGQRAGSMSGSTCVYKQMSKCVIGSVGQGSAGLGRHTGDQADRQASRAAQIRDVCDMLWPTGMS